MHTDITEESLQKYRPGTVSERLLGGLKLFILYIVYRYLFMYNTFAEMAASDSFARSVLLRNYQ